MTGLQILELALEGAKAKLGDAAHFYENTLSRKDEAVEKIRSALAEQDEIIRLIKESREEE